MSKYICHQHKPAWEGEGPCHKRIQPKLVRKKWGHEVIYFNDKNYCMKLLHVNKDIGCSIHLHQDKSESFLCTAGKVAVYLYYKNGTQQIIELEPGHSIDIPQMLAHRFAGMEDSDLIECSTQHFDSDSYRIGPSGGGHSEKP